MTVLSMFPDVNARSCTRYDLTSEQLAEHLRDAREYPTKADCPLLKLAVFGDTKSENGSLRHDGNVIEITGIEGDYDGGEVSFADVQIRLFEQGIEAHVYTSASHTPEKPRWRVLCELSRAYPPSEHGRLVARLNGALGGILAPESFTLSQSYYVGRVRGAAYQSAHVRGTPIDLLGELDAKAIAGPKKNGTSRHERLNEIRRDDPVINRLNERGMALRARPDGAIDIICPFEAEHTTPRAPGDCVLFPAHTGGFKSAHFKCLHSHCSGRPDQAFMEFLGFKAEQKASRKEIISSLIVKTMNNVEPERLDWLNINNASGRYARGKVTLFGGDPGTGKSLMCCSDEAAITRTGGGVVVFSAEDDAGDTLRPRYDIASADVSKIIHVDGVRRVKPDGSSERHAFNLERDIETLRALLAEHRDVVFVRIDPVTAYLGKIDSHKNAEVRALLAQLEEVAREFRVAIAVVTHLNKSSTGPALYRFVGSLAFVAACRLAFVVARDPENADRRLVVPAKANITADQQGYAFTIAEAWHEGIGQSVARVDWEAEPINVTLEGLVQSDNAERRHERERVKEFLKRELASGPVDSKALFERAAAQNISERTLFRAKGELQIPARRMFGSWHWAAPSVWEQPL